VSSTHEIAMFSAGKASASWPTQQRESRLTSCDDSFLCPGDFYGNLRSYAQGSRFKASSERTLGDRVGRDDELSRCHFQRSRSSRENQDGKGKRIDGHAPMLSGKGLYAYLTAGIGSDHECTTLKEAKEKLKNGNADHDPRGNNRKKPQGSAASCHSKNSRI